MFMRPLSRRYLIPLLLIILLSLLVAFLVYASEPGMAVEGCPQDCAEARGRRAGPLRVVSLNMLHGYPDFEDLSLRLDLIAAETRHLDADVLLLQEVPWITTTGNAAQFLAQKLGYNHLYYRSNGNRSLIFFEEGEAILSRFPLKDARITTLAPRAGLFESRVALGATAVTPWGEVALIVTHLSYKDAQVNSQQVQSLRTFVNTFSGSLAVVAGDFNAREDSPQITNLNRDWTDAYRALHPVDEGWTCCIDNLGAGPEEPLEKRIDYIFVASRNSESFEIIRAQRVFDRPFPANNGWQWISDHAGLLLEIEYMSRRE